MKVAEALKNAIDKTNHCDLPSINAVTHWYVLLTCEPGLKTLQAIELLSISNPFTLYVRLGSTDNSADKLKKDSHYRHHM